MVEHYLSTVVVSESDVVRGQSTEVDGVGSRQ